MTNEHTCSISQTLSNEKWPLKNEKPKKYTYSFYSTDVTSQNRKRVENKIFLENTISNEKYGNKQPYVLYWDNEEENEETF